MDLSTIIPNFETETETKEKVNPKGLIGKAQAVFTVGKDGQLSFEVNNVHTEEVDVTVGLGERQKAVYNHLKQFGEGATAKELAVAMRREGLVPSPERNSVHPRLRELVTKGLVKVVGKKTCQFTDRTVSIYKNN
jgi:hypothetical protein